MRIRSRWWVLAVLSLFGSGSAAYGQRDPLAFASLGTLNVTSGALNINTDTLTMSGAATFTGVLANQNGGPQIAVFDFSSINIGAGVSVFFAGTRPISLLSRGTLTVAANLNTTNNAGYFGAAGSLNVTSGGGVSLQGLGPGGGSANNSNGAGGGYGGMGGGYPFGAGIGGSGGAVNGNLFSVLQGGSGGGVGINITGAANVNGGGGYGGTALELSSIGAINVANITVNGASGFGGSSNTSSGYVGAGGGAGGGILLNSTAGVTVTGTLSVSGGNGFHAGLSANGGGGGGGGRIGLGGLSTYTLGTTPAGITTSLNGGNGSNGASGAGYAGTITVDAFSTTVPSGTSITLNGNPVTSIAGSTTQTGATVEAYVRKDLVINSGGTATLGIDNALRRLDSSGNNITALTVNGTFNTGAFSQIVSTLSGSGTVNLNTGGSLIVGENDASSTFSGNTSGTGGLTKLGSGTLTLSGFTISHSGPTMIQAGTLEFASGGTITSSLSGGGTVQKSGAGAVLFRGNNNYTGPTRVLAGTLQAGSNTAFGSNSPVFVDVGATLDLNGYDVTIGSLQNSGSVLGGTLTMGGNNGSTSFSGSISGLVSLIKTGNGQFIFDGSGSPMIQLAVDGGFFALRSSMNTMNTRVGPNGTLNFTMNGVSLTSAFSGIGSSSTININANNISLGSPTLFNGFNHQGILNVANNTVNLQSLGFAQLGSLTTISGGTINAPNGVAFGSGSVLDGNGTVNAKVSAQLGSVINANGNLSLGSSSTPAGFVSAGELRTNANTVTLNSSSRATLGSLTTLGNGGSPGTVAATNGVLVDFGNSLVGYGTINTPNNLIQRSIINGTVEGNSGAQPITFTGWIKGAGTFNNVVFAGTWDPGFSPTLITAGSLGFSSTNNLIMELGGLTRGSQFDGIEATGNVNLAGALSITRINGFSPNPTDAFVLINRTGGTGTFAGLNEGDTFLGTDGAPYIISYQGMNYMTNMMAPGANSFSVVIAAVPEPTTWALIGLGVAGCSWAGYRRFRKGKSILEAEVIIPD